MEKLCLKKEQIDRVYSPLQQERSGQEERALHFRGGVGAKCADGPFIILGMGDKSLQPGTGTFGYLRLLEAGHADRDLLRIRVLLGLVFLLRYFSHDGQFNRGSGSGAGTGVWAHDRSGSGSPALKRSSLVAVPRCKFVFLPQPRH